MVSKLDNEYFIILGLLLLLLLALFFLVLTVIGKQQRQRALTMAEKDNAELSEQLAQVSREGQTKKTDLEVALMRLQEQDKNHQQRVDDWQQSQDKMQKEFELLSNKLFEENRKKFESTSQKSLSSSLQPIKSEMEFFRQRIDLTHQEDLKDRSRLQGQIIELQKQAQQIGQDAVNLANALKGDNKTQGNWGELILNRLLEDCGLEKGREYDVQKSYDSEESGKKQPDVIVHMPEGKDIIIDSKVSLIAYEKSVQADSIEQREVALKEHVSSLREHIKNLSSKEYQSLKAVKSLDFVLLFVPIEPAYMLALQADQGLFQFAYDKNVVLVSPTTLMPILRTVTNIWRVEKQNKNADKIAEDAGRLYDKFVNLVESLDSLGQKLKTTQTAFDLAQKQLSEGTGNLVTRVQKLKDLGAKTKKKMPPSLDHLSED